MGNTKDKKEPRYYHGIQIDSDEEEWTLMWLEELAMIGFVDKIERSEPIRLANPLYNTHTEIKILKTKSKESIKRQKILDEHVYTSEFKVTLTEKAMDIIAQFIATDNHSHITTPLLYTWDKHGENRICYIEVKPEWDQNNMERLFKINQKWMWEKYQMYINLIKPLKLMEKTFTPFAYLTTATGKKRLIHHEIRTLNEWLETLNK